jgi:hypothetical protein
MTVRARKLEKVARFRQIVSRKVLKVAHKPFKVARKIYVCIYLCKS